MLTRIYLFGLALLVVSPGSTRADLSFNVTLNTSSLQSRGAQGPFAIDFTLTDGGAANVDHVSIMNISFGAGGSAGSPTTLVGGASGNLGSTVTLTDPSVLNDFTQTFTPGALLRFQVTLTTTANMPTPDNFSFSILDGTGTPLPTTDPSSADTLLNLDITGPSPTINTYASPADGLLAPTVTFSGSTVPEPASLVLLGSGLAAAASAGAWARHRRRQAILHGTGARV